MNNLWRFQFLVSVEMERRVWKLVCYLFYVGGGNVWMEVNVHRKKEIFESFLTSLPTSGKVAFLMSHSNSPNFIFYLPFTFKMSSKFEPWLRATVWIQTSEDGNGFVSCMFRPGSSSSSPTLYSLYRSPCTGQIGVFTRIYWRIKVYDPGPCPRVSVIERV